MEKLEARLEKALDELNLSDAELRLLERTFREKVSTAICDFCWFKLQQCKLCKAAFPTLKARRKKQGIHHYCPCHNYPMKHIKEVTQRILKWIDEREGNHG